MKIFIKFKSQNVEDKVMKCFLTLFSIFCVVCTSGNLRAQQPTVGLLEYSQGDNQDGYVLFAPISSTTTYLINKCGEKVHEWSSMYKPGLSVYLLEDGSILRSGNVDNPVFKIGGGAGGVIERIGWDGTLLWSYALSSNTMCQHHDIYPLPNGNVLAIIWESKSYKDVVDAGRDTAIANENGWFDKIIEINPTGKNTGDVVWQWSSWDHLVQEYDQAKSNYNIIADNPTRININYSIEKPHKLLDWLHFNSIDYNADLDQILVNAYGFGEVWVLDHSTTTKEAATQTGGKYGKGGDLLYRWGNAASYDMGTQNDRKLFGEHNAHWIQKGLTDAGKIMVFNNGLGRKNGNYSSVDIINPPILGDGSYLYQQNESFGPEKQDWIYTDSARGGFSALSFSSSQRLSNGNTLICVGTTGEFFEVTPNNKLVWRYVNPATLLGITKQGDKPEGNSVFRANLLMKDFTGFNGKNLSAGKPIELEPYQSICTPNSVSQEIQDKSLEVYPNPAEGDMYIHCTSDFSAQMEVSLINSLGDIVSKQHITGNNDGNFKVDVHTIPAGIYVLKITNHVSTHFEKVMIVR